MNKKTETFDWLIFESDQSLVGIWGVKQEEKNVLKVGIWGAKTLLTFIITTSIELRAEEYLTTDQGVKNKKV